MQRTTSVTLREECSGKKRRNVNAKFMLKMDHLKRLAIWATAEVSMPSLGAVFGHRLSATAEALGVPPDPSFFSCQRSHYLLPFYLLPKVFTSVNLFFNLAVIVRFEIRIEKIKAKSKQIRRKPSLSIENSVVYNCHFCSHRNLKRGTRKDYMKELCPPKARVKQFLLN